MTTPTSLLPSVKIKLPTPDDEKQPQALDIAYHHVGQWVWCTWVQNSSLGERHTTTFPSDPERLNLHLSDEINLFQKSKGLTLDKFFIILQAFASIYLIYQ